MTSISPREGPIETLRLIFVGMREKYLMFDVNKGNLLGIGYLSLNVRWCNYCARISTGINTAFVTPFNFFTRF